MTMMSRNALHGVGVWVAVVALTGCVAAMSACSSSSSGDGADGDGSADLAGGSRVAINNACIGTPGSDLRECHVTLDDGSRVTCVIYKKAGLSCDWEHAEIDGVDN